MEDIVKVLSENQLFLRIDENKLEELLTNTQYLIKEYAKDSIIAQEGEVCNSLALIVEGEVELQRLYESGASVLLKRMKSSDVFGEALMFSNKYNYYPATIIATSESKIIFIKKEDILQLCLKEKDILENFIELLSDKVFILNNKIKNISFTTIRQKVINYILEESKSQKTNKVLMKMSKERIAEELSVPRPSFSRELIKLREDGLIEFDRKTITILDKEELENEML